MKRYLQTFRRLAIIGLAVSALGACAVVPYNPPGYYGPPERTYVPLVPVPAPYFYYRHHGHHWRHGHRGYR